LVEITKLGIPNKSQQTDNDHTLSETDILCYLALLHNLKVIKQSNKLSG